MVENRFKANKYTDNLAAITESEEELLAILTVQIGMAVILDSVIGLDVKPKDGVPSSNVSTGRQNNY